MSSFASEESLTHLELDLLAALSKLYRLLQKVQPPWTTVEQWASSPVNFSSCFF